MITHHYKTIEKQGTALRHNIKAHTHIAITDIKANWVAHIRKATVLIQSQLLYTSNLRN